MLNHIVLVGRLVRDAELLETESGKKVTNITVAVPRSFKNADGEFETDFIECVLWGGVAENTAEYCKKGDMLGIKGRLQTTYTEKEDGSHKYKMEVVAERITYLSSKNQHRNDRDDERY